MKIQLICILIYLTGSARVGAQTGSPPPTNAVESLICIRHGEKPPLGLGQLTCQGFNRALALPKVLLGKFGAPQFVFAADPTQSINEYGTNYNYVRPLATVEPTAIYCGLPVNTQFGFPQITNLEQELLKDAYQNATIFIAWEHVFLVSFAQEMLAMFGADPSQVPAWQENDYDTIFIIKIARGQGQPAASFAIDHEGLNDLSGDCPQTQPGSAVLANSGVRTNRFGFNLTAPPNSVVVIQASTNLANSSWFPLATNTLTGGSSYFYDPQWTDFSSRFYRLSPP